MLSSCGSRGGEEAADPSRNEGFAADIPELEIRTGGIDRFTVCPPPGDLGQHWIPPLPPWTPPGNAGASASTPLDQSMIARAEGRSATELAVEATHQELRSCYRQSLVRNPTADGRVALVLRVDGNGRVARVESYAACELTVDSIACMYNAAERLRFPPPSEGSDTVTIPATFTSRDGMRRTRPTPNDAYTAAAYLSLEAARPALHSCEEVARREGRNPQATGTFTLDVSSEGRVTSTHVDPWTGDQVLLKCAARSLEALRFNAPPRGTKGTVIARLNFNPRQGAR